MNPLSGGLDKTEIVSEIELQCQKRQLTYSIYSTVGNRDLEIIREICDKEKPSVVVACGGDGTINLVADAILERRIILGILPLGSANGLARELNISNNVDECFSILQKEKIRELDVLFIQNRFISLHLSGIGFNARMIKKFESSGKRGYFNYAWHVLKELTTKEIFITEIQFNNQVLIKKLEMLVFANGRQYGNGAIVNPDGKLDDGLFEIGLFEPYPRRNLLILTYLFFTGKLKQSNYIQFFSTKELWIQNKKPQILQVDGEIKGDFTNLHIRMHELKLSVIVNC